jgi:hypothetical protein
MTWIYEGYAYEPEGLDPKILYGFVYEIENTETRKKYIGKKFFWASKTYQRNLRRRRRKVESDWKNYYGSSVLLSEDIETLGREKFKRTILRLCKTKAECAYFEAKYQFDKDVLLKDEYYNAWIMVKVRRNHLSGVKKC